VATLCVVGAGYVGLVAAASFAAAGHVVRVVDRDPVRRARVAAGVVPWFEPELPELLARAAGGVGWSVHAEVVEAVAGADVLLVAAGTPAEADGRPRVDDVEAIVDVGAPLLARGGVVLVKSTVPVGTCDALAARVTATGRPDVVVVANPEFLAQATAVADFLRPDRVVLGADDAGALDRIEALYRSVVGPAVPILRTTRRSAELGKYAANLALAARVSLINEVAALAEATGADVAEIRAVVGSDRRVGSAFLAAGAGWGGSCFPKELAALVALGEATGVPTPLVHAVRDVNAAQPGRLVAKAEALCGGLGRRRVALWGLAYKPGTDDLRDAPSHAVAALLRAAGASIVAWDPVAGPAFVVRHPDVTVAPSPLDAARGADVVVVLTEWPEVGAVDLRELAAVLGRPNLVDGRNVFAPWAAASAGLRYAGVGRPTHLPPPAGDRP
jgi:UDPglucose 6-dehydrogenase